MAKRIYDFDTVIPRENTSSFKWDYKPGVLPLWVADMDFRSAPCILEAIQKKVDHGIFGYTRTPDSYYNSVINWWGRRHGWTIRKEWILPVGGLVPGTSICLTALSGPGDGIIMNTPAYNAFFHCIKDCDRILVQNKLCYRDGKYCFDFEDFERRCQEAKVFLLCNPHNPSGRLWTRGELERLGDICIKNGVTVISDEIHCDIVPPGSAYTPFASIKEEFRQNCVSLISPTKCFNIAGLQVANIVTANPELLKKIEKVMDWWVYTDMNQIGEAALQGAFTEEGENWLDQMNAYVHQNYLYMKERFAKEFPQVHVCDLEATYLAWADFSALMPDTKELQDYLIDNYKVWINSGAMYGDDRFVRINVACPRATLKEGLDRVFAGLSAYLSR
ncbi:MAG: pyridoxal phosphate-dependent aminotransferase [Bacteroidales bacterium]|nr:pyridoxal phosphate-dependent aminotransferase [Bacteroidales bacterium]